MTNRYPLSGFAILVVEDEMFIAYDIASELEEEGAKVVGPVASVAGALDIVDRIEIDGAILDVNLLDGDVDPVLDILCARGTPAVINTGSKLPLLLSHSYPDVPVFSKPTPPRDLASALRRLIGR